VGLPRLKPPEPLLVSVDHFEGMVGLGDPEVEVSNVSGKLMPVECGEPPQLVGHKLRDVFGERHQRTLLGRTPSWSPEGRRGSRARALPAVGDRARDHSAAKRAMSFPGALLAGGRAGGAQVL